MKKIGAILLVAGTCIGSGMIALPLVLAKLGLIASILLMLFIWFIMYYTSLINLELNLQAGRGLTIGELGKKFSGPYAEWVGIASLKLLSFSLLAVFIYGGSSILKELLESKFSLNYSFVTIASFFSFFSTILLLFPIRFIDYFNRLLFISLLTVVTILILGLTFSIHWSDLPLFAYRYDEIFTWTVIIPVVFTSFGFQVIFHTLTNYCNQEAKLLKKVFFWGSLIPAIVYILWTSSILSVVFHENPAFYHQMVQGKAEVGELIQVLSQIAKWEIVQLLIWSISLLAIVTSIVGVGIGLLDSVKGIFSKFIKKKIALTPLAALATIVPAYIAVLLIPNAFISVLSFAGMILSIIAIILPTYLFWKIKPKNLYFKELKAKWMIQISFCVALIIIACEIYNIF